MIIKQLLNEVGHDEQDIGTCRSQSLRQITQTKALKIPYVRTEFNNCFMINSKNVRRFQYTVDSACIADRKMQTAEAIFPLLAKAT